VLDIELDPEKQDSLERMGSDELQVLAETLIRDRAWP
jgi:hypothetical protein